MINEIYNKQILGLAADISRTGLLDQADQTASAHSRLCGSKVTVSLKFDGDRVVDFGHVVKACALGQASSSVMASNVVGSSFEELKQLRSRMHAMLKEGGPPPGGKWQALEALEPVRDYKVRHASTLLTFDAVCEAVEAEEAARLAAAAADSDARPQPASC